MGVMSSNTLATVRMLSASLAVFALNRWLADSVGFWSVERRNKEVATSCV